MSNVVNYTQHSDLDVTLFPFHRRLDIFNAVSIFFSPHRHDALKLGKDFAKQTNCSVNNIICLLSLTPQAVLTAQMKTSRTPSTLAGLFAVLHH